MLFALLFMYGCAFALTPLILYCMWAIYTGDQMRAVDALARVAEQTGELQIAPAIAEASEAVVAPIPAPVLQTA